MSTPYDRILGQSPAAQAIREFAHRAARIPAPVLLTGETGTGKGLLARVIHDASPRAAQPFIAVNCAGIPETLFESEFFGHTRGAFTGAHDTRRGLLELAHHGTLFLDEIGELPLALQAKLLTALEDGEIRRLGGERTIRVDARIISATGVDLLRHVHDNRFRRDLYHRLVVLSFRLPALRERPDDIPLLARHFLSRHARRYDRPIRDFEPAALRRLLDYPWPGNIRELSHAIEAAVIACDDAPRIAARHLPDTLTEPPSPLPDPLPPSRPRRYSFYGSAESERRRILDALRRCHGNKTRAAAFLGMARNTLHAKIRALGLDHPHPTPHETPDTAS